MNPYPGGQCTWGAAEMFPCLQNIAQYGNFGNGGDWFHHAQAIGLPTSDQPQAGWLASFRTEGWPDGTGDVGLIVSVNSDNTITRYGTNWHMDGKWSTDKVSKNIVIGSFKPPCAGSGTPTSAAASVAGDVSLLASSQQCHTFQWSFPFGVSLCFDTLVAMTAIGGGVLIAMVGLVVIVFGATGYAPSVPKQSSSQTPEPVEGQPTRSSQQFNSDQMRMRAQQRGAARRQAVASSQQTPAKRSQRSITAQSVAAKVRAGKTLTTAEVAYGNANQEAVGRALASMAPTGG